MVWVIHKKNGNKFPVSKVTVNFLSLPFIRDSRKSYFT